RDWSSDVCSSDLFRRDLDTLPGPLSRIANTPARHSHFVGQSDHRWLARLGTRVGTRGGEYHESSAEGSKGKHFCTWYGLACTRSRLAYGSSNTRYSVVLHKPLQ